MKYAKYIEYVADKVLMVKVTFKTVLDHIGLSGLAALSFLLGLLVCAIIF